MSPADLQGLQPPTLPANMRTVTVPAPAGLLAGGLQGNLAAALANRNMAGAGAKPGAAGAGLKPGQKPGAAPVKVGEGVSAWGMCSMRGSHGALGMLDACAATLWAQHGSP